jgi:hypothetical protein
MLLNCFGEASMGKYKVVVLSPVPEALIKMWVTPVAQRYGISPEDIDVVTVFEPRGGGETNLRCRRGGGRLHV